MTSDRVDHRCRCSNVPQHVLAVDSDPLHGFRSLVHPSPHDSDALAAEREHLMAEQERLLLAGVPLEDLARLVDVGDQSITGDEAPKVTTAPATQTGDVAST